MLNLHLDIARIQRAPDIYDPERAKENGCVLSETLSDTLYFVLHTSHWPDSACLSSKSECSIFRSLYLYRVDAWILQFCVKVSLLFVRC